MSYLYIISYEVYILLTQDLTQEGNCPSSQYLFVVIMVT